MRKLTKPEYYAATRTEKNRQYAIQSVFHAQPGKELCTSTIPLLARIRPGNIGISKMATITEIGTFPGIKQFTIRQTKAIDQAWQHRHQQDGYYYGDWDISWN